MQKIRSSNTSEVIVPVDISQLVSWDCCKNYSR